MNLPKEIEKALILLERSGHEAYVVGGCVRDEIMGIPPHDFDITTSALPADTAAVFKSYKVIETGLLHGTVTVIINSVHIEITTYRIDGEYTDNRRPDTVNFTRNLKEDLSRRDFTMNALCYNPKSGITDIFGGVSDIRSKQIRAVGVPDKRFAEDALRILRALRFAAAMGFEIEAQTARAIFANKNLLQNISAERIAAELNRIVCAPHGMSIFCEYFEVFAVFIPQLLPCKNFNQNSKYHCYDVLLHSITAAENIAPVLHLRIAALLHDIGKPATYTETDGEGHFYTHAHVSEVLARDILNALKYDNETKHKVLMLVKYHDITLENRKPQIKRWLSRLSEDGFFDLMRLKKADTLAQHENYHCRILEIEALENTAREIVDEKECFSLKTLAINGHDLIELGYPKTAALGTALKALLQEVICGSTENTREALLARAAKGL